MSETKSISEVVIDEAQLRIDWNRVTAEKVALQAQLSEINSKCATRIENGLFRQFQKQRSEICGMIQEKEAELSDIKAQIQVIKTQKLVVQSSSKEFRPSEIKLLVAVREKWHDISFDEEQSKERRKAAWEIVKDIQEITKPRFAEKRT